MDQAGWGFRSGGSLKGAKQASKCATSTSGVLAILTMPIWPDGMITIATIVVSLVVVYLIYGLASSPK